MTDKIIKTISFDGGLTTYTLKDEDARADIGTLSNLTTTVKSDLVAALNEVNAKEITVDTELNESSINPVENRVIMAALSEKQDLLTAGAGISISDEGIISTNNYCYFAECPGLTPSQGMVTWNITHNLGTQQVSVSLYHGNDEMGKDVTVVSDNVISVSFPSTENITAGDFRIVVLAIGGIGSSAGTGGNWVSSYVVLSEADDRPLDTNEEIDLSAYLPNDNSSYEVYMNVELTTNVNTNRYHRIELLTEHIQYLWGLNNSYQSTVSGKVITGNSLVLPIGPSHKFTILGQDWPTKGHLRFVCFGYRKMGVTSSSPTVDSNFIPRNTTFTIEADGSGDFEGIQDVFNYLEDKWSNGVINIHLGTGTFTITDTTLICNGYNFNIPNIKIYGDGSDKTIIASNNSGFTSYTMRLAYTNYYISNIKFQNIYGTKSGRCLFGGSNANIWAKDLVFENYDICLNGSGGNSRLVIENSATFYNSTVAVASEGGGMVSTTWGVQLNGNNIHTLFFTNAGFITATYPVINVTNLTQTYSPANRTIANTGMNCIFTN